MDACSECGAGITGLTATCPGCDAEATARAIHAAPLAEARREVPMLLAALDVVSVLS